MSKVTGYEVDGAVASNLEELAVLLGEKKVTKKDIAEGGKFHDMVSFVDLEGGDTSNQEDNAEEPKKDEVYTALTDEQMEELENIDAETIKANLPDFENIDEVKEFIKDLDLPTLEYLATGLGLSWNPTYHKNIHRMRIAMEFQKHFFPELFAPKESKKKKAKYGDFSTDTLFEMVEQHGLEVKKTGNEPIDRMNAIMTLKKNGVLVEE